MKNPIKKLEEIDNKFCDIIENNRKKAELIVIKVLLGTIISLLGATVLHVGIIVGLRGKENKDFQNGKYNPSIKEANVLSVNRWTNKIKLDVDGNGKFNKEDFSIFNYESYFPNDVKSFVYIDGVGKKKPLAYKRESGKYVIYRDSFTYLKNSENLNKEFYDYMKDKKFFDLVKAEKEIETHTR
ncbi:hypothetical protein HDR60_05925 [bacterium]|nr:hypothetical protein [bacterium]